MLTKTKVVRKCVVGVKNPDQIIDFTRASGFLTVHIQRKYLMTRRSIFRCVLLLIIVSVLILCKMSSLLSIDEI